MQIGYFNEVFNCIGTGRLGLALHKEYCDELEYVQKKLGFKYIRGHGLFSDDIGIYQEKIIDNKKIVEYNFTYLDRIMDFYRSIGIKPFLELSFMPSKLASGKETVFYWKGNITPPDSINEWIKLVQATLKHLLGRYGDDVLKWPIEIWNEPNLDSFWKDANKEKYFDFFKMTFQAIKDVNKSFKVGGPVICGVDDVSWMKSFIKFCEQKELAISFISRHFYTVNVVPTEGHYRYPKFRELNTTLKELAISKKIIDQSSFKGLPMFITEFSTSYSPDAPVHDTVHNAAYVAEMLSKLGETSRLYSYWTFGDVFEEKGIPFTQFYGGFGLVSNHSIPKPTFWTFYFYKHLFTNLKVKDNHYVITYDDHGNYAGIVWNYKNENGDGQDIKFKLPKLDVGEKTVVLKKIDETHGNPLKAWHDLGEPPTLKKQEISILKMVAKPEVQTFIAKGKDEKFITIKPDSVVYFAVKKRVLHSDCGYNYQRLI